MKKRIVFGLLALALVIALAGCGGTKKSSGGAKVADRPANEKVDPLNQKDKLPLKVAVLTGFTQPNSRTEKWLEERYNVDIDIIALPGWSDAPAKISLLMTDANQRPDVIWWWGMDADFAKWKDAGLLVDVSKYIDKYTVIRDYYNSQDPSTLYFASSEGGKIFRIPGDVSEPSCEVLWIRQDWLDNLGLKVPTTLAELDDVLYKFTFNDPDKNGKNDTYGLGGDGHDFRTFWPWIQGSGNGIGDYANYMIDVDGSFVYGPATNDAKIWLGRIAKLYKDGVVTPNIINDTDRDEEFVNGGFGVAYTWVAYNNPGNNTIASFQKANPTARWVPIEMVVGDNGKPQEEPATAGAWCYFGITNVCKDPERVYAMWDDMTNPAPYLVRRFGEEGKEYSKNSDGSYTILISNGGAENDNQNIGMRLFADLVARKDFANIENLPSTTALFTRSGERSRDYYSHYIEKKDPNAYVVQNDLGTEVSDAREAYFWSVVAGTDSIDNWDKYIANLKSAGLDQILAELKDIYGKQQVEHKAYLAGR
ncbi:putative ABC transporter peptide-binding protein YtcQ [Spirochaetia bacterium]|nr:putative ABC transporter peptide-binding protein YtcQ [Spirochaetia bacterium]